MIFEEIDDFYDAMMLGLAHDTLMVIGWGHIRALFVQDRAPWAGGRLICVGDYGQDLPEGVMSEEEQKELYEEAYEEAYDGSEPENQTTQTERTKGFNLYAISGIIFGGAKQCSSLDYERYRGLSSAERLVFRRIDRTTGYDWKDGWVLMNLSKQQYVKSMTASSILPSMHMNDGRSHATDARCLGQLILSRICWSTDDSCAMDFEGPLHRGVWAGDRFRIVTLSVFETRTSGEEWTDVSVEAAEWLKSLWDRSGLEY